jgi:hypothetical protein
VVRALALGIPKHLLVRHVGKLGLTFLALAFVLEKRIIGVSHVVHALALPRKLALGVVPMSFARTIPN